MVVAVILGVDGRLGGAAIKWTLHIYLLIILMTQLLPMWYGRKGGGGWGWLPPLQGAGGGKGQIWFPVLGSGKWYDKMIHLLVWHFSSVCGSNPLNACSVPMILR